MDENNKIEKFFGSWIGNDIDDRLNEVYQMRSDIMAKDKKFIQKAIKHPGALHKKLGVPEGKKIPAKKFEKALHSKDPNTRKQANLAKTLKKLSRHKKDY